jgi:hypothetical protein
MKRTPFVPQRAGVPRDSTQSPRPRISAGKAGRESEVSRKDPRHGAITIREIALFIGLVAIAQRILPRPLDLLAATSLPALYFPARIDPRLARPIGMSVLMTILLAAFLPTWHTSEPADFALGKITSLALAPLFLRIVTWRDRSGLWDFLDPLVIAGAPLALTCSFAVMARLFEVGVLAWN